MNRPIFLLVLSLGCQALFPVRAGWIVVDAEVRLRLNEGNLHDSRAPVAFLDAERDPEDGCLVFRPARWGLGKPDNGLLPPGGMDLPASFALSNEVYHSVSFLTDPDGRAARWVFASPDGARHEFLLTHPHTHFDEATGLQVAPDMDVFNLSLLPAGASAPGFLVAAADWTVRYRWDGLFPAAANDCVSDFGPTDLELLDINTTVQLVRTPGDRVALAPSARLHNIGSNDARWEWAILPATGPGPLVGPHPFLVLNFYRIHDGRLEPLGRSDAKHAWNSTNEGCGCPSGQVMYQGCSDVYSAANNGNQFYFGPRAELNPFTGAWSSLGSHFDGAPVDNVRNHFQAGHGQFDHRLTVPEAALGGSNDLYHVEAWYLSAQDTNTVNNIGHVGVLPALSAGIWQFPSTNTMAHGPAVEAWVPAGTFKATARHGAVDTGEGRVHVAARVRRLDTGRFRYDYAVYNRDFGRGISGMDIPALNSSTFTNRWFADGDAVATNDWTATSLPGCIRWSANSSILPWGELRSFSLESTDPPAADRVLLAVANPAVPGQTVAVSSLVPSGFRLAVFERVAGALAWDSLPEAVYHVERAGAPGPAGWADISGPVPASGLRTEFEPGANASPANFFRVVLDFP